MGKLMTARLRDAGWTVAAIDLAGSKLDAVAVETGAAPHPCDVSDDNQSPRRRMRYWIGSAESTD
jgi:3-hydroxyisobutyrate dehydrogenase-like beta-hydroxyacid dehydrogenase